MSRTEKYYKKDLKQLKKEYGPSDETIRTNNSSRRKCIQAVSRVINERDVHTVPDIAKEIPQFSTHEIFNTINFMMKYNGLKLINKRGDYPEYGFGEDH